MRTCAERACAEPEGDSCLSMKVNARAAVTPWSACSSQVKKSTKGFFTQRDQAAHTIQRQYRRFKGGAAARKGPEPSAAAAAAGGAAPPPKPESMRQTMEARAVADSMLLMDKFQKEQLLEKIKKRTVDLKAAWGQAPPDAAAMGKVGVWHQ